jgi:hypothetical protein
VWAAPGAASYTTVVKELVRNSTGSTLTKGQVVYISGANGTHVLVSLADADTEATSSKTLGFLDQNLANNADGYVITAGLLDNVDTAAATAGQSVWLSGTPGGYVFGAPPAEPAHSVYLGVVMRANGSNGQIVVKVQNGYELDELHDVSAGSPSDGDQLVYNSTTGLWTKAAQSALTIGPSQVTVTAVITTDSRLSNARTPTAHASTHASGGSDPITLAQSQVTSLTADLAAKAATTDTRFVPPGTIAMFGSGTAPSGWLLCNGGSTSGYTALAAVVGANVPDLRNRFIVGAGSTYAQGATGGATTHNHGLTSGWAEIARRGNNLRSKQKTVTSWTATDEVNATSNGNAIAGTPATVLGGTTDDGSTLPPYYALTYIIKT